MCQCSVHPNKEGLVLTILASAAVLILLVVGVGAEMFAIKTVMKGLEE